MREREKRTNSVIYGYSMTPYTGIGYNGMDGCTALGQLIGIQVAPVSGQVGNVWTQYKGKRRPTTK